MNDHAPPAQPGAGSVLVGVDIGGTGTRFVAVTHKDEVLGRAQVRTPSAFTAAGRRAFFRRHIDEVAQGHPVAAVGIGATGPIVDGVIQNPDTLPGLSGTPLAAELEGDLGVPVAIDNDTVVAAIAEYEVGAARAAATLLHVTLGTGIGTALLLHGEPFRGGDGKHPEGGHITTAAASRPCYCGRRQCWEQAASRTALQAAAADVLGTPPDDPTVIAALAGRARNGEFSATDVFQRYGAALGDGLGTVLSLYRPTHVTLGGSVATYLPYFARSLDDVLRPLGTWISACAVTGSALGDHGGALGAALLASRVLDRPLDTR